MVSIEASLAQLRDGRKKFESICAASLLNDGDDDDDQRSIDYLQDPAQSSASPSPTAVNRIEHRPQETYWTVKNENLLHKSEESWARSKLQLTSEREIIYTLKEDLKKEREAVNKLTLEMANTKEELSTVKLQKEQHKQETSKLLSSYESLNAKYTDLLHTSADTSAQLRKQLDEVLHQNNIQSQSARDKIDRYKEDMRKLKLAVKLLKDKERESDRQMNELRQALLSIAKERDRLYHQVHKEKRDMDSQTIESMIKGKTSVRHWGCQTDDVENKEVKELSTQLDALRDEMKERERKEVSSSIIGRKRVELLCKQINTLKNDVCKKEKEIGILKSEIKETKEEIVVLKTRYGGREKELEERVVKLHDEIVVLNDCLRDKKREGEEREKQLQVDIESKELECHRKCEEKDVYIQEATAVAEELRKKLEVCVREREKLEVEMKKCEDSVTRRDVLLNRAKERVKTLLKEKQELKQQVSIMKKNCEEEIQAMNQRVLDNEEAHKVEVKVLQDDIDKLSRQAALAWKVVVSDREKYLRS